MIRLPQNTVDKIAVSCSLKMSLVIESLVLSTEDLVTGRDGRFVRQHVEEEHRQESVNVTTHRLNSMEKTVAIFSQRTRNVMYFHVQWTGNTLHGATGRNVHQHAVVAPCFALEPVVTHLLNMVEGLVADLILNMKVAILIHVLLMADSRSGMIGLLVQTLAVEVCLVENGFVTIQSLNMVVITVLVCLKKQVYAMKTTALLMGGFRNGQGGHNVREVVVVDLKSEIEHVTILFQDMVEIHALVILLIMLIVTFRCVLSMGVSLNGNHGHLAL